MMREKAFFHSVAKKIAKPNLLILFNRWDCTDFEDKTKDLVKEQHLQRACGFLVHELHVAASLQDAANQIYFVSAKEVLNSQKIVNMERSESWNRFCAYIEACLDIAAQGARYGPLIDAGNLKGYPQNLALDVYFLD